jgi:hypothetical protein
MLAALYSADDHREWMDRLFENINSVDFFPDLRRIGCKVRFLGRSFWRATGAPLLPEVKQSTVFTGMVSFKW